MGAEQNAQLLEEHLVNKELDVRDNIELKTLAGVEQYCVEKASFTACPQLGSIDAIAKCDCIRELILHETRVGNLGFLKKSPLSNLVKLCLSDSRVTSINWLCDLSLPSLEYLDLSNNRVQEVDKGVASESLLYLDLSNNDLAHNIDLRAFPNLQYLDVSSNQIKTLQVPPRLHTAVVAGNTNLSADFLASCRHIELLDMSHTQLYSLRYLHSLRSLKNVILDQNLIHSSEELLHLAGSAATLQKVYLAGNTCLADPNLGEKLRFIGYLGGNRQIELVDGTRALLAGHGDAVFCFTTRSLAYQIVILRVLYARVIREPAITSRRRMRRHLERGLDITMYK